MFFGKLKDGSYGFGVFTECFESFKEIDIDEQMNLIKKANSEGKLISADKEGNPLLVDPPEPSEEEKAKQKIAELEGYLSFTDWYAIRYADTNEQIPAEIKIKRQEAREEISRLREEYPESNT